MAEASRKSADKPDNKSGASQQNATPGADGAKGSDANKPGTAANTGGADPDAAGSNATDTAGRQSSKASEPDTPQASPSDRDGADSGTPTRGQDDTPGGKKENEETSGEKGGDERRNRAGGAGRSDRSRVDRDRQGQRGKGRGKGADDADDSSQNKGQGKGRGDGEKAKGAKATQASATPDKPTPPQMRPPAQPAVMRRRHYGLIFSFFILVLGPLLATSYYVLAIAKDQFASSTGFAVRTEEGGSASDLLGGLANFAGGASGQADSDILFEFIASQEVVQRLNENMDLVAHYAQFHDEDPIFSLAPDATIEDLVSHWRRIVRVSYEQSSGLIDIRILAFDPDTAQQLAQAIVRESQTLVNELNAQARNDAMQFAEADLDNAVARLRAAREALTEFRTRTQIVDPESDLQGRMGVLNNLQQQLAEALIEYDLLSETATSQNDPRLQQASRRIEVIRDRIREERRNFTLDEVGAGGQDYPTMMAEFEGLVVDREIAEESYRAALTAVDAARTNATRQSRYLAVFIRPTLAESSEFPRRFLIIGLAALFLAAGWAVMALIYYSIRDRQ